MSICILSSAPRVGISHKSASSLRSSKQIREPYSIPNVT
jgi:hypothetical protein